MIGDLVFGISDSIWDLLITANLEIKRRPTPLKINILVQLVFSIVEAVCRHCLQILTAETTKI